MNLNLKFKINTRQNKSDNINSLMMQNYIKVADLNILDCEYEVWPIKGSNASMGYATHSAFRYFGKFPPPVAERFINELHDKSIGPVIDPMVGSGTTLVEANLLNRDAIGFDINPLSVLISKVKTTLVSRKKTELEIKSYDLWMNSENSKNINISEYIPEDKNLNHWFYPEVQNQIGITRKFIDQIKDKNIRDLFLVGLAAIIRNCSRASNGLGRMFLDRAIEPVIIKPLLIKRIRKILNGLIELNDNVTIKSEVHSTLNPFPKKYKTNLVICHPPYFNVYKYSSIYKYELLWTGFNPKEVRLDEIRESFKIGKEERVHLYVDDLVKSVLNISSLIRKNGWFVLMMGDTTLREKRINTTSLFLNELSNSTNNLKLDKLIIRIPKYTEASYAATQRRNGKQVGVKLYDHILLFKKNL